VASRIEWTDATWNPVTGCTKISPGCKYCYAERLANRLRLMGNRRYQNGFEVTLQPDQIDLPLRWRKPRRVFVNSMSDLFHDAVPLDYVDRVFDVMARANRHVFQILTKRPDRMSVWHRGRNGVARVPDNVWIGVSVESMRYAWRVECLREVDAQVRFISAEPLLGALARLGPKPEAECWLLELRDLCQASGVAFFFKQWGGRTPKAGGRELAGQTWSEYPVAMRAESATPGARYDVERSN
jgi:protein gp37